ncbi:MAG: glycoside hydrolase family 5 protein [Myxococcota bacterium]
MQSGIDQGPARRRSTAWSLVVAALPLACTVGSSDDGAFGTDVATDSGQGTQGVEDTAASDDDAAEATDGNDETGTGDESTGGQEQPPTAPDGYYVLGNTIYHESGTPHVFRGVDRPSLEWNDMGEDLSPQDYQLMASWGSNAVRIALNQGFWLEGSVVYAPGYPERIDQQIEWAHAAGMDVILDLHWSDRGDWGVTPGQQRMADNHSVLFWSQVAQRYADDGRVIFELYNEPHDVTWQVWRDGGDSGDGFMAVGMQTLYDTVRNSGADNLVVLGGLDYGYDLSGVPGTPLSGYNITYATHPYDLPGKGPSDWDGDWGNLTADHPVLITEFGTFDCSTEYLSQLISYAAQRDLSWTAWAWYPGGCDFPSLINDWAGTPSAAGQIVRTALMAG